MQTTQFYNKNTFLPYMCETTVEFLADAMFKSELVDILFGSDAKNADVDKDVSNHSDTDTQLINKSKFETDHSSNASKQPSRLNSPAREDTLSTQISNLNIKSPELSSILWKFISERYVPYLAMLNSCNIPTDRYQGSIQACLERYFPELSSFSLKQTNEYIKDNKLDKKVTVLLTFGVQLMALLACNASQLGPEWRKSNALLLNTCRNMHDRLDMSLGSTEPIVSSSTVTSTDRTKTLMTFYAMLFLQNGQSQNDETNGVSNDSDALMCASAITSGSSSHKHIDDMVSHVATTATNNVQRKRNQFKQRSQYIASQDPEDMLRNARRKRSKPTAAFDDANISLHSPQTNSMNVPLLEKHLSTRTDLYAFPMSLDSSQDVHTQNSHHGVQRKQDKSRINKHYPLDNTDKLSLSSVKTLLNTHKRKTLSSNTMLGSNQSQRARMKIKKAPSSKSRKRTTLGGSSSLALISQASFKIAKGKQLIEASKLKTVTEEVNQSNISEQDMQVDNQKSVSPVRSSSCNRVILKNTPKKAEMPLEGAKDDEFEF